MLMFLVRSVAVVIDHRLPTGCPCLVSAGWVLTFVPTLLIQRCIRRRLRQLSLSYKWPQGRSPLSFPPIGHQPPTTDWPLRTPSPGDGQVAWEFSDLHTATSCMVQAPGNTEKVDQGMRCASQEPVHVCMCLLTHTHTYTQLG